MVMFSSILFRVKLHIQASTSDSHLVFLGTLPIDLHALVEISKLDLLIKMISPRSAPQLQPQGTGYDYDYKVHDRSGPKHGYDTFNLDYEK
ncbi:hypothetical protein JCM33374_g6022 [Metschnikowia sp. JCM 33374]|nr:hypothetical protein JCM33374_g6022 [Metschnikowia sp. JCM 33374]